MYLTVFRGTPIVVQLMIIYYVIFASMDISKVVAAILAFGINSGVQHFQKLGKYHNHDKINKRYGNQRHKRVICTASDNIPALCQILQRTTYDKTGKLKVLNWICNVYLTVFRGTPIVGTLKFLSREQ